MGTTSRYFNETKKRVKNLKFTDVPPADAQRLKFFRLSNPTAAFKKSSRGKLQINRAALASFRASKRTRRLPITYELKWELACSQNWKCKICKVRACMHERLIQISLAVILLSVIRSHVSTIVHRSWIHFFKMPFKNPQFILFPSTEKAQVGCTGRPHKTTVPRGGGLQGQPSGIKE